MSKKLSYINAAYLIGALQVITIQIIDNYIISIIITPIFSLCLIFLNIQNKKVV
jgi:hypothetical protein